ncbi:MAG: CheR family methyltransferase [Acidobacteriota bacterium]
MAPVLSDKEFSGLSRMIFDQAGIHMAVSKKPLVSGRLNKRLNHHGLNTYGDYLKLITQDGVERQIAIDLLTTNETFFFREPAHFQFLSQVIAPQLHNQPNIRIWCGASSTGEEPYTIAMTLAEALGHMRFDILASDISTRVLETARKALYPIEDVKDIPVQHRIKHCLKGIGPQEGWFLIDDPLRHRIQFEQINLNAPLPDIGTFDVIFLRNVMIYFSQETKRDLLGRLVPLLRPGGYFVVSHSESLHGINTELEMVKPSIFRKP